MDSLYLREILLKIGKDLRCPTCHTAVSPQDIRLTQTNEAHQECDLMVMCHHCNFSFGGKAKMIQAMQPEGKKFNASSLAKNAYSVKAPISSDDKENLTKALRANTLSSLL